MPVAMLSSTLARSTGSTFGMISRPAGSSPTKLTQSEERWRLYLDGIRAGQAESLALLARDGRLVKRPFVLGENFGLLGFDPKVWQSAVGGK